jgi:hypothetical protein
MTPRKKQAQDLYEKLLKISKWKAKTKAKEEKALEDGGVNVRGEKQESKLHSV